MMALSCTRCGAEIVEGAKFCRRCGQPFVGTQPASVAEEATRLFDTPPNPSSSTAHVHAGQTGPAYLAPGISAAPDFRPVAPIAERPRKSRTALILISVFGVLLLAFGVLIAGVFMIRSRIQRRPAQARGPELIERQADQPSAPGSSSSTNKDLIYPGAEIKMNISGSGRGDLLQMHSSDPIDKIVDWYKQRLNATKPVAFPGAPTILTGNGKTAIITPTDDGTMILLKSGESN